MRNQIAHGAAWMISMRLADRALGLVSTLILARLLIPADFGLIAMAMSFIALIELAGAFSFEVVLIQRADPTRAHYDTAWTLNLAFALGCALLMTLLGPIAADFYNEPRLVLVMLWLAAGWVIQGTENIGIVNFRRSMNFSREFVFMFGKRVVGFVVTLALAYFLRNYWALVFGQLATRIAGVALSYALEPYRPRISVAARKDLFAFSGWLLMTNAMVFGLARLSHFIVGRAFGTGALGIFAVASEIAKLPSTEISAPINRALFPGLARLANDPTALRRVFVDVVSVTLAITLPASVGLALVAGPLVAVMLGTQWQEAAPILAVLAISGAVEMIAANNGIVYLALGNPRILALLSALKLGFLIAFAFVLVPRFGLLGMAWAELAASAVAVVISTVMALKAINLRTISLAAAVWRPTLATVILSLTVVAVMSWIARFPFSSAPLLLLAGVSAGVVSYIAALYGLWVISGRPPGAEQLVLGRLRSTCSLLAGKFAARS